MMKEVMEKQHDINWGALNRASHAPQLMSCNHYVVYECVSASECE